MRRKFLVFVVLALLTLAVPASTVLAQGATSQTWTSSITYYTPSSTGGTLQVDYYANDGTKYSADPITLNPHKAGSLLIGNVSTVPDGFAGSAVLSSEVPIVATNVQFAAGTAAGSYGRLLYSGFSEADASNQFYVPTVLYGTGAKVTSRIGVQNVETFAVAAHLAFYAVGATSPSATKDVVIPAQSSYIFWITDIAGIPSPSFNGSMVVTATKDGDPATAGRVVAASEETKDSGPQAYAFEGSAQGANKIYMASMMCKSGAQQQISYYAIQNVGTGDASVTINAYDTSGNNIGSTPAAHVIPQGGKWSPNPCDDFGVAAGKLGSAVIESVGAPIIAIGKIQSTVNGMATAFVGAAQGSTNIAAPYVRWAADPTKDFRAYIAIMNVGDADATNVQVKYYDGNGNLAATDDLTSTARGGSLGPLIKRSTDAPTAGALTSTYSDFGFHPAGGAIEVTSDQPVVVVVRQQRQVSLGAVTLIAEDYNGTAITD
jgi:hypothetical protein